MTVILCCIDPVRDHWVFFYTSDQFCYNFLSVTRRCHRDTAIIPVRTKGFQLCKVLIFEKVPKKSGHFRSKNPKGVLEGLFPEHFDN